MEIPRDWHLVVSLPATSADQSETAHVGSACSSYSLSDADGSRTLMLRLDSSGANNSYRLCPAGTVIVKTRNQSSFIVRSADIAGNGFVYTDAGVVISSDPVNPRKWFVCQTPMVVYLGVGYFGIAYTNVYARYDQQSDLDIADAIVRSISLER